MMRRSFPTTLLLICNATFCATGCADSSSVQDAGIDGSMGDDGEGCDSCERSDFTEVAGCASVVGESFDCEGHCHVAEGSEIDWQSNPPHSGDHYPVWERDWGEHAKPVPRGRWVHNLEHGGVVLLYDCPTGCDAELAVLRDVVAQRPEERIILTPDPLLEGERFAAVSWTWVYRTDAPDLATLLCFVDQHEGNAPEDVM